MFQVLHYFISFFPVTSFQVSHTVPEILIFRLQQNFKVGLMQPSSVTAYEYYNPGKKTQPVTLNSIVSIQITVYFVTLKTNLAALP